MPKEWYDKHSVNKIEDIDKKEFYRSIVADKKPYFMKYIYPDLMKQYNTYIKNTNRNALREFQMTVDELKDMPDNNKTEQINDFLRYYEYRMPVGTHNCVMNRICHRFEEEFDRYISKHKSDVDFDYTIMKSDKEYTPKQFYAVKKIYEDYNKRLKNYAIFADCERIDNFDVRSTLLIMNEEFQKECEKVSPNQEVLCNIILDICYAKNSTKRFAWNMCGKQIINNLLNLNANIISYPVKDDNGDIEYCGNKYSVKTKEIGVDK